MGNQFRRGVGPCSADDTAEFRKNKIYPKTVGYDVLYTAESDSQFLILTEWCVLWNTGTVQVCMSIKLYKKKSIERKVLSCNTVLKKKKKNMLSYSLQIIRIIVPTVKSLYVL